MARTVWILLALAAATIAVYGQVSGHEFVDFDDHLYVTSNPYVLHGWTPEGLRWAFTTGHANNWHPLTWLSHMTDVQFYGLDAGRHHLTNLVLHIANGLLLFGLLSSSSKAPWPSAATAALFLLHPLHVESVAWVSERKDVLSTLFWMLATWAYVGYAGSRVASRRRELYACTALCMALGLLSKATLVTLPFVLLLLDYWPLGRIRAAPGASLRAPVLKLALEKVPLVILSIAASAATFLVQQAGGSMPAAERLSIHDKVANALVAYARYLYQTIWPSDLAVFYPHPALTGRGGWGAFAVVSAAVLLLGLTWFFTWMRRRSPCWIVGWLWYLGTLVPMIGLVQVGAQSMADRYTYVPLIGLFVAVSFGAADAARARRVLQPVFGALAIATVIAVSAIARRQVSVWRTTEHLASHALDATQDNWMAHLMIGTLRLRDGRFSEASEKYSQALSIHSGAVEAMNNLAFAQDRLGETERALSIYAEVVQLAPGFCDARYNYGELLARQERLDEAIAEYRVALEIDPDRVQARNNLAAALATQGKHEEALAELSIVLQAAPEFAQAHFNLGLLLTHLSKPSEAADHLREALRLDPELELARQVLANLPDSSTAQGVTGARDP